jgi:hypothetical protein
VQHPGGRAQVRGPVQPDHHPVGAGLVEDQAELPGKRHQRHEGVQVSGHDRRLQAPCCLPGAVYQAPGRALWIDGGPYTGAKPGE